MKNATPFSLHKMAMAAVLYDESSFVESSERLLPQAKPIKMKIFQSSIEYLATVGVTAQRRALNVQSLFALAVLATIVILVCGFLLCEASNFKEYTESIYVSSVSIAVIASYSMVVWKKENIFLFNDSWVKMAVARKHQRQENESNNMIIRCVLVSNNLGSRHPASKMIYDKIIENVDKYSRFIHFVLLKITVPCFVLPKYIVCFYLYFATDRGNDAFELPLPVW